MTSQFNRFWQLGFISFSLVLLTAIAAPAQSPNGAAKAPPAIKVDPIDADGMKALLKRDAANPRPLLVNFWATWCDPCREEFPDLVKIDHDYRERGLDFVVISLDDVEEIKTTVPEFLSKMQAAMPAYLLSVDDPGPAVAFVDPHWSGALPATFLFDAQGNVVFKYFGRFNDEKLRAAINRVVKSEKPMTEKSSTR